MGYTICVVDASPAVHRLVEQAASTEGYTVTTFKDATAALEGAKKHRPDLFVVDYHLDGMAFPAFCDELRAAGALATASIIALVTFTDRLEEEQMEPLGVRALLKKPLQPDYLLQTIKVVKQHVEQAGASTPSSPRTPATGGPPKESATSSSTASSYLRMKEKKPTVPGAMGIQQSIEQMVMEIVSREVAAQVEQALAVELPKHLGAAKPEPKLDGLVAEALDKRVPNLVAKHIAEAQPALQKNLEGALPKLVGDLTATAVSEHVSQALAKALPEAIKSHLASIEQTIKDTVRDTASQHARVAAEEAVQPAVKSAVDQTVKKLVPDLAEDAIKKEIARLTA